MEISDISKVMREELSINGENKKAHLKQGWRATAVLV